MHVTGPLMTLPGKFEEYLALKQHGLNTIELDVKDESGNVGVRPAARRRSRARTAPREPLLRPAHGRRAGARGRHVPDRPRRHLRGPDHLGRASRARDPARSDGSLWKTSGGLGWLNPYNRDGLAATTSTSRSPRRRRASTRSSSTTSASRATATSRRDALPGRARAADERDDPGVLPLRDDAPPPARRARLGRRLRALGDARARDRPASRGRSGRSSTRSTR